MKFEVDDWVLLSTKHLRQRRPNRKLADKFIGPYQIVKKIGNHGLAFKLRLPPTARIHPVFPITSLEPYRPRSGEVPESPVDDPFVADQIYEVEEIRAHRRRGRNRQYLIKWRGYSEAETTWEPRSHINDSPLLQEYIEERASYADS